MQTTHVATFCLEANVDSIVGKRMVGVMIITRSASLPMGEMIMMVVKLTLLIGRTLSRFYIVFISYIQAARLIQVDYKHRFWIFE
jgi:hypothetical protein